MIVAVLMGDFISFISMHSTLEILLQANLRILRLKICTRRVSMVHSVPYPGRNNIHTSIVTVIIISCERFTSLSAVENQSLGASGM